MIVLALGVTCGRPTAMALSVSAADSGIGKTGCGWAPKTRPENQRLVGGTRPAASRVGATVATFRWVTPARSAVSCESSTREADVGCGEASLLVGWLWPADEVLAALLAVQAANIVTPANSAAIGARRRNALRALPVLGPVMKFRTNR